MAKFIILSPVSHPLTKIAVNVEAIDAVDHVRWDDKGHSFIYIRGWRDSGVEATESVEEVMAMITGDVVVMDSGS